ncbi:hypothetical protein AAC387_Pa09g1158 [Persea americana]
MGSCVSSLEGQQKEDVEEVKLDCNGNKKTGKENTPNANIIGLRGPPDFEFLRKKGGIIGEDDLHRISSRVCLSGASAGRVAFLYTQQGTRSEQKNVNQDAMLVWENFCSREDTIFCGVFDGHGPFGHVVSKKVRVSLPFKLFCLWKACINDLGGPYAYASVLERMSSAEITSTSSDDEWSKPLDTNELKKLPEKHLKLKHSLLKAFKLMNEELKKLHPKITALESGTTAVTLIKQDLVIGNVGDSRAVLGTRDEGNALVAIQLTVDLKPDLPREAARIEKHGGMVRMDEGDVPRLCAKYAYSGLAMSRAFGDFELKQYGLISIPEISYHQITQRDEFIIVATDGVWDVLSNEEAVDIVASTPCRGAAAKALVNCAQRAWHQSQAHYRDDCTAVCLFLDSSTTTSRGTAGWKSQTSSSWAAEGSACTKDEKLLNRCQSTRSLANSISTTKEWPPLECATRMNYSLQNLSSFGSHHENYINFR